MLKWPKIFNQKESDFCGIKEENSKKKKKETTTQKVELR